MWTGGHVSLRVVKMTWADLDSLASVNSDYIITILPYTFIIESYLCHRVTGIYDTCVWQTMGLLLVGRLDERYIFRSVYFFMS
jgi:hypothetical protein